MRSAERLQRLEDKRAALLRNVEPLPPEARSARLRPDKWTIHEIVEHLVLAEEDVLVDLERLDTLEARPRRFKDRVSYHIVMFVLKHDIPVRAPSSAMLPRGGSSLEELGKRWETNHGRIRDYAAGLDSEAAGRAIFLHPIAGPLTMHQALHMLEVHLDRHARQVQVLERLYRERRPAQRGSGEGPT